MNTFYKLTLPLIFSCLLWGCTPGQYHALKDATYESFQPMNAYEDCFMPDKIMRVAVLPLHSDSLEGKLVDYMDQTFKTELNKKNLFEVVHVSRYELIHDYGLDQFDSTAPLPPDLFVRIYERTGANALMFIDLTDYRPYKPISLGVRAKLIDVTTGKTVWACDTVFDSGNPKVAVAARRYELRYAKKGYPLETGTSILHSPNLFAKYVAHDAFETLPPREY